MRQSSQCAFRKHCRENLLLWTVSILVFSDHECTHHSDSKLNLPSAGCDLNDLSAPLPQQHQIRRMMKRQVMECGIQVAFLCIVVIAKIRLCTGHKQGRCPICVRCFGYLPAGCTLRRFAAVVSHSILHTACFQKLIQRMISTRGILRSFFATHFCFTIHSHFNSLRERKYSTVNAGLGFEREHLPHLSSFACK